MKDTVADYSGFGSWEQVWQAENVWRLREETAWRARPWWRKAIDAALGVYPPWVQVAVVAR